MDKNITIMIVENDEILAQEIKSFLKKWGYQAVIASHFDDIIKDFSIYHPQLILMDINLPYYDGFYWCHQLRRISDVPIIYISSRNEDHDKIMGMAQGGDDYVDKPFNLNLLKAKIEAILRRTYQYKMKERLFIKKDLYYEPAVQALYFQNKEIDLTKSERKIIKKLMENPAQIVTRDELMIELWNTDEFVSDGTLTTLISRLRSKLKAICKEDLILTKKGQGYFIQCDI